MVRILKPEEAKNRENSLLKKIIEDFVETKKPVASDYIVKKYNLGLSSATVRNIMKVLEDKGFLYHPHTSSGRVPTDKAYRFYVDYLNKMQKDAIEEKERVEENYNQKNQELEKTITQTSKMLAMLSKSIGFVYIPNVNEQTVKRLDFMPLGPGHILAVLITKAGTVKHWPIRLNYDINPKKLRIMSEFINDEIRGLPINKAYEILHAYTNSNNSDLQDIATLAKQVLTDMQDTSNDNKLYLEGLNQIMENITNEDMNQMQKVMKMIEEKEQFVDMLKDSFLQDEHDRKVRVSIGKENQLSEFKDLSLVSSTYKVGDKVLGVLGVVGPKHMNYDKMIHIVDKMSGMLQDSINNWDYILDLEDKLED